MSDRKAVEIERVARGVKVTLTGSISEISNLNRVEIPDGECVIFDFGAVTRINSHGVMTLMTLLQSLAARPTRVEAERVPPCLVDVVNMVPGLLDGVIVQSFLSPWMCGACGHEDVFLHRGADPIPDARVCSECGGEMLLDAFPEQYFKFLSRSEE